MGRTILTGAIASLTCIAVVGSASAATITPTTFADEFNTNPAGCSLREAVQAANNDVAFGGCPAGSGGDAIPLATGTYQISLPGAEFFNANGSIDILSPAGVTISHEGLGATVIDGGALDRAVCLCPGANPRATISGVTIRNAKATSLTGGALFANGNLTLTNSTLTASSSTAGGAGFTNFGVATLTNVTISGNSTADDGGGIELNGSTTTLNSVTIADNIADSDANGVGQGGGLARTGAADVVSMTNTLISGNTDRGGQAPDCFVNGAPIASQGNNFIGNLTGCGFTPALSDKLNVNPLLGPLADNGGSTFTHALAKGSLAVGGAGPGAAPTDQRGVPRTGNDIDIGAYEYATCGKVVVNRVGTAGKDTLSGTNGADGIFGLDGKDLLKGLKGKDGLCGGNGKDTLKGGGAKDKLIGGKGADKLSGGGGNDVCKGGKGKDTLDSC